MATIIDYSDKNLFWQELFLLSLIDSSKIRDILDMAIEIELVYAGA